MTAAPPRLAALRHHDFRLLWAGNFVSIIGTQMQLVAINWHIYQLLAGSSLTVDLFGQSIDLNPEALGLGMLGLVRIIPIALFALVGGTLADITNRRTLLLWTNAIASVLALALAALSFSGRDTIGVIYLLTALTSATAAFMGPAMQSLIPNLVPPKELTNAISLNSTAFQTATIVGPSA
jgi:MFS family permease